MNQEWKDKEPYYKSEAYRIIHRLAVKTYRERHRAKGLCLNCNKKPYKNRALCKRHLNMAYEQSKRRIKKHLANGLCERCSKPRTITSSRWCDYHKSKAQKRCREQKRKANGSIPRENPTLCSICFNSGHNKRTCPNRARSFVTRKDRQRGQCFPSLLPK